jgi:hypothetical protein
MPRAMRSGAGATLVEVTQARPKNLPVCEIVQTADRSTCRPIPRTRLSRRASCLPISQGGNHASTSVPAKADCGRNGAKRHTKTIVGLSPSFSGLCWVSRSKCREPSEIPALARLFRETIEVDHYPLSPQVQIWKGPLAKIRPEPLITPRSCARPEDQVRFRGCVVRGRALVSIKWHERAGRAAQSVTSKFIGWC